jgi:hypothetical protein
VQANGRDVTEAIAPNCTLGWAIEIIEVHYRQNPSSARKTASSKRLALPPVTKEL